jgi:hypothetical protein
MYVCVHQEEARRRFKLSCGEMDAAEKALHAAVLDGRAAPTIAFSEGIGAH